MVMVARTRYILRGEKRKGGIVRSIFPAPFPFARPDEPCHSVYARLESNRRLRRVNLCECPFFPPLRFVCRFTYDWAKVIQQHGVHTCSRPCSLADP